MRTFPAAVLGIFGALFASASACSSEDNSGACGGPAAPPPVVAGPGGPARTFKVYVAGESIEARNQFFAAPFAADGTRDDHGADANRSDEFGWMVPFADALKFRDANLSIEWVGGSEWSGIDDASYAGTYPTKTAPRTGALSGTSIPNWIRNAGDDLVKKKHCYDVAVAARGGNDFKNADDAAFKRQLAQLLDMLASGSSCRPRPLILVTSHMPDDRQEGSSTRTFVEAQSQRYRTRIEDTVRDYKAAHPDALVRFIDAYSGFCKNWPTKAVPDPGWFTGASFDFSKIHRDGIHPKRLSSIYVGELVANAVDLAELRALP